MVGFPYLDLSYSDYKDIKIFADYRCNGAIICNIYNFCDQQKGLNADLKSAYNKYCRVIIEYFKEDRSNPTYGRGDPFVVDRDVLSAVNETAKENCRISGTPLLKILSTEAIVINGFPVLYYSYRRMGWLKDDGKRQSPVIVNVYTIFNKYEFVKLTFSYREAERENWKDIHNNIMKSFTFIHKY